ncbi:MAG: anti-sigma regulatory factor [Ruminococcaceae bacterium]|nr:anti-sigma regulatory factor [Oscillospiraceae bacterium]
MMDALELKYTVTRDDFARAGEASGSLKKTLKTLGFSPDLVRRVAIAMYEAEINMVIHAQGGEITATVTPEELVIVFADVGPGIPDINLAMTAGFSTATDDVRDMGFGAGMGLPNIKKYADDLEIQTQVGVGTTVTMRFQIA